MSAEAGPPPGSVRDVDGDGVWELLLPAGWVTIPTAEPERQQAVKRLLDRTMRGRSRDELAPLRIEIDRSLRAAAARAGEQGARFVHSLFDPVRGVPVSATLVVVPVTFPPGVDVATALESVLSEGRGVLEHGRVELGRLGALRRRRRFETSLSQDDPTQTAWQTNVEYVVETAPDAFLLLTFTTVTDPVADELVGLFDAMASTLRRRGRPG